MLVSLLQEIPSGCVRTFLTKDVRVILGSMEDEHKMGEVRLRAVIYSWSQPPLLHGIISDVLFSLAEVARSIWPNWYGGQAKFEPGYDTNLDRSFSDDLAILEICKERKTILKTWLREAVVRIRAHRSLILPTWNEAVQSRQLAAAIEPDRLVLVLAVEEETASAESLFSLSKAAEWYAEQTRAGVGVVIPSCFAHLAEIQTILYKAIFLEDPLDTQVSQVEGDSNPAVHEPNLRADNEDSPFVVWPRIEGKPHPGSPGEMAIANSLANDEELNGLFGFNRPLLTAKGSRYVLDLVWPEGKLAVEIDGYRHHYHRQAFRSDRHRDYELTLSGYTTLRLPHDEVVADVKLVLEKIRDVVRYIKQLKAKKELNA